MTIKLEPYCAEKDRAACLAAFDSNVPQFFDESERSEFAAFLDTLEDHYVVVLLHERVIGCGGVAIDAGTAHLCWGMMHQDWHGNGYGRALLDYRLNYAESLPEVTAIALATSQHTEDFYAKKGFEKQSITYDGWAPGLHRVEMLKRLKRP